MNKPARERGCLRRLRLPLLIAALLSASGCYYVQAARGQLEVIGKREPIDRILEQPDTSDELARRLRLLKEAREFSIAELGLPDNDSYRTFADLDRDYVVWNVIAAPELAVEARTWCFPVVGCVSYRGYFSKDRAEKHAARLKDKGYDTFVGGVTAYSTLGNFDDPVLSTMLKRDDASLVALLFHELAHQVLYIKDDTAFNESFATAVEEVGLRRWLAERGTDADWQRYRERKRFADELTTLALTARDDLAAIYASGASDDSKREMKTARLEALRTSMTELAIDRGVAADDPWLQLPLNNARLAVWSAYESHVPAFIRVFEDCEQRFSCFYAEVEALSALDADARNAALAELGVSDHRASP